MTLTSAESRSCAPKCLYKGFAGDVSENMGAFFTFLPPKMIFKGQSCMGGGFNSHKQPGFGFTAVEVGKKRRLEQGQGITMKLKAGNILT